MKSIIITIDGASSTGKSSLARALAKHYGFKHIDSGAMYRALTFYAQDYNILANHKFDIDALIAHLPILDIDFSKGDEITLNGKIINHEIRSMSVSNMVSLVAKEPKIREFMVAKQRQLGAKGNVVMDGRDIGSVVFPNATIKFFLKASMEVRTNRRYADLIDQFVEVPSIDLHIDFDINSYKKTCLINGYDDIDFLINNKHKIEEFERKRNA